MKGDLWADLDRAVTEDFFPLLGIRPWLGRNFTAEECLWGAPRTAIVSYEFRQRRLGAKAEVIGGSITLDGTARALDGLGPAPTTIVGVLPPSFDFDGTFSPDCPADLFLPFPLSPATNRRGDTLAVIGRLKPGLREHLEPASGGGVGAQGNGAADGARGGTRRGAHASRSAVEVNRGFERPSTLHGR